MNLSFEKLFRMKVREMTDGDAVAVNLLSQQLGYPLSVQQTLQNIHAVLESKDHTAFVAVTDNKIIGWIGAAQSIMLEIMPHCEINGLVIDENYRGKGVGRLLVERVKQWAKEKGNDTLTLRCNVKRTDAHLFYEHLGFKETKQQKNYRISI
jgi:GNAT superfamily N-acetyltransferase